MPLSDQEKTDLKARLELLVELNEPEALMATMQRVAERQALEGERGLIPPNELERWRAFANALKQAEIALEASGAPQRLQHAPEAPQNAPEVDKTEASG